MLEEDNYDPTLETPVKFIASVLAHSLSKILNRKDYEVVFESHIDLHDDKSAIADVVIYDIQKHYHPVLIVQFFNGKSEDEVLVHAEITRRIYNIKEYFIYNANNKYWTCISEENIAPTSYSQALQISLDTVLNSGILRYT